MFMLEPPEKLLVPDCGAWRSWKKARPAVAAPVGGAVMLTVEPPLIDTVP